MAGERLRLMGGFFAGVGALLLLYQGEQTAAVAILASMLAFFVGERNGRRGTGTAESSTP